MPHPVVSIVILNWNGKKYLEQFLPAVIRNTPEWASLVVADNGSTDDSLVFLKSHYPAIRIIELPDNLGYAGGYNTALNQVEASYYVLLNSDMEVGQNWIEPMIRLMEDRPDVAACQPKILSYHKRSNFEYAGASGGFIDQYGYPFCRGRIFDTVETDREQYNDTREVFWASGACMCVRAADFREVGGFDERFFAHMEEIDLCWRFHNAGMKVMVCPDAAVYHVGGGTLPKSNPKKTFLNFRNSLWVLAKNLPNKWFYPTLFMRLIMDDLAATSFFFKGQFRDFLAVYRAWWAFVFSYRAMRTHGKNLPGELPALIRRRSIVIDYYLKKNKYFSELPDSS